MDKSLYEIISSLKKQKLFPHENRPFEKPIEITEDISKVKNVYFSSIKNYANQMVSILKKDGSNNIRLAMFNLRDAKTKLSEMQNLFKRIYNKTNIYCEVNNNLCEEEYLYINKLIVLNDYYLHAENNNFFNINLVKLWKIQKEKQVILTITEKFKQADHFGYEYILPTSMIEDGNNLKLPIIIKKYDMENEEKVGALLVSLVSISESKVDYIYLLFCNDAGIILRSGLSVSKFYLSKLKTFIETGDESIIEDIIPPLPIEISQNVLGCFANRFDLEKGVDSSYLEDIDTLYLRLWEYCQYAKYLSIQIEGEKKYLYYLQTNKKNEIETLIKKVKDIVSTHFIEIINDLKIKVINENYYFDDMELNILVNEVISYAKKN